MPAPSPENADLWERVDDFDDVFENISLDTSEDEDWADARIRARGVMRFARPEDYDAHANSIGSESSSDVLPMLC